MTQGRLATLTAYDCWALLETAVIARVAWIGSSGVAAVPVNCTVADGAVWFRTSPHSALGRECGGQRVAIEVDEVDTRARSGWSVVVIGTAQLIGAEDAPETLIGLSVWPAGSRSLFVRVEPDEVTGRKLLQPTTETPVGDRLEDHR